MCKSRTTPRDWFKCTRPEHPAHGGVMLCTVQCRPASACARKRQDKTKKKAIMPSAEPSIHKTPTHNASHGIIKAEHKDSAAPSCSVWLCGQGRSYPKRKGARRTEQRDKHTNTQHNQSLRRHVYIYTQSEGRLQVSEPQGQAQRLIPLQQAQALKHTHGRTFLIFGAT